VVFFLGGFPPPSPQNPAVVFVFFFCQNFFFFFKKIFWFFFMVRKKRGGGGGVGESPHPLVNYCLLLWFSVNGGVVEFELRTGTAETRRAFPELPSLEAQGAPK